MRTNEITEYNKNMKQQILNLIQDSKDFEYNKITEYCNELNITVEPQREEEIIFFSVDMFGLKTFYNFTNIENFKKALNDNKFTTQNNLNFFYKDKLIFTFDETNNVFQVELATDTLFTEMLNETHGLLDLEEKLDNLDY